MIRIAVYGLVEGVESGTDAHAASAEECNGSSPRQKRTYLFKLLSKRQRVNEVHSSALGGNAGEGASQPEVRVNLFGARGGASKAPGPL